MLLSVVEEENFKFAPKKICDITNVIGFDAKDKSDKESVDYIITRIKSLAENVMKHACTGANSVFFDKQKIIDLFKKNA